MSKKITSFLVLLAAVLLVLPTQAQTLTKGKRINIASQNVVKSFQKANAFTAASVQKQKDYILKADPAKQAAAEKELAKAEEWINTPWYEMGKKAKQLGYDRVVKGKAMTNRVLPIATKLVPETSPMRAKAPAKAEEKDSHGIIIAPAEGEVKHYTRSGQGYTYSNGQVYYSTQSGDLEIVETADNTVYIKNFISSGASGYYVKGTKNGNTITIPVGQPISYNSNYSTTLSIFWGAYDESNGFTKQTEPTEITFTIDGDVITLNGSNEDLIVGIFWDDDNSFSGYGDYETVWTYNPDYVPASTELIVPPTDMVAEDWNMKGVNYDNAAVNRTVSVGFVGDDVYIKGLSSDFPESWVKGTVSGNTITFAKLQYLGESSGYPIWAIGYDTNTKSIVDFTFTYDAEAQSMTLNEYLVFNAKQDEVYYLEILTSLTIFKGEIGEPTAQTGDPVEVPYTNGFSPEEQGDLGIIDGNDDSTTWMFVDASDDYYARYNFATGAANDWFVTPAVKLEAGKTYQFSIDVRAQSTNYPERIEVMMGTEPKASALTTSVIPATDVTWTAYQPMENNAITVTETGYYHFGIHAISDADMYYLIVDNLSIEEAADPTSPAAVTDLTVTPSTEKAEATITFTAPTKNLSGDNLTENISKIELLRDDEVIATFEDVAPGTQLTYTDAEGLTLGKHTYQVITYNKEGKASGKGDKVTAQIVAILDVPYTADFAETGVFDIFTVIDNNNDGKTWSYSSGYATYSYSDTNNGDDYLVTLPIRLKAGKKYSTTVLAAAYNANYPERFEVVVGKSATAAALTQVAIEPTVVTETTPQDYSSEFTVSEDGIYYVAIHAISDADEWSLRIKSLTIEKGLEPNAPAAPLLTVTPDATGEVKADIDITAPGKNISGNALNKKLSKIELLRDGEVITTFENVAPSAKLTYTDADMNLTNGKHVYQAVPYDFEGEPGQKSEKVSVFLGIDAPDLVESLNAQDNLTSLTFTWPKVGTVGANGGLVNTAEVDYNIYGISFTDFFGYPIPAHDPETPLVTVRDAETAAIDLNTTEGDQEYKYYAVTASNIIGETDDTYVGVYVGKPYELPFVEHFGSSFNYATWVYENNATSSLDIATEGSDGDGSAINVISDDMTGFLRFFPGKISLGGAVNPKLTFDVKTTDHSAHIAVVGVMTGGRNAALGTVNVEPSADGSFQTVKFDLKDYANEPYILPHFVFGSDGAGITTIDNISIKDLLEYDLSVDIAAQASVQAGDTAPITVTVTNEGDNAISNYTVRILANGEELLSQTIEEELGSLKSKVITAELATTIFDDAADITLTAEVAQEYDLDEENNSAETLISVKESTVDGPTNAIAQEVAGKGIVMYWTAPTVEEGPAYEEVTENFQSYDNAANVTGLVGDWTLVNNNGATKGGVFNGISLGNDGTANAWEVFKPSEYGMEGDNYVEFVGPQGSLEEAYLISAYNLDQETSTYPDNDDWLISPELPGIEQTITYHVKAFQDYGSGQAYQVLASSTDKDIASFTVVDEGTLSTGNWEEHTATLPAGTKYFAIRNASNGDIALMFCVGDLTFLAAGGSNAQLTAFNIYVDGNLYATVEGDQTTYTVPEGVVGPGEHEFAVSAVYDNGQESKPVVVNLTTTSIDELISSNNNQPMDVYTLDGKLVRSKTTDLNGLKGVFVVNGKAVILK